MKLRKGRWWPRPLRRATSRGRSACWFARASISTALPRPFWKRSRALPTQTSSGSARSAQARCEESIPSAFPRQRVQAPFRNRQAIGLRRRFEPKGRVGAQKLLHLLFPFLRFGGAHRIDEQSAGCDGMRAARQNRSLELDESGDVPLLTPVPKLRMAVQRTQARAGRVHQHRVEGRKLLRKRQARIVSKQLEALAQPQALRLGFELSKLARVNVAGEHARALGEVE